ncbi:MAG TPA: DEAD/DEAH box helicase [Solirubrobacteraceae bacterium]|nr:DEAD/DEAH box helicase [Solirubrobacteraceae bacterium]
MSKQSFAELGVSSPVCAALARRGVSAPFPVQRLVLADVLAGRDVLVKSPTGSGKTLAFGVPLVELLDRRESGPAALILAPTRELAVQILAEIEGLARARNLRAAAVYGGTSVSAQAARAAKAHILVATPGRLEDLLSRQAITLAAIKVLVLDEADRMLDMGFRPAIDRIVAACPQARQTLFFSATLEGVAGKQAARYTRRAVSHEHVEPRRHDSVVEHRFVPVREPDRVQTLVEELGCERELALVFVRTKRGADRLVKRLDSHGVQAVAIHGNKSQRQREQALTRFKSGRVDTLVATDVAARGIDVEGVSHVINFDPPGDDEAYVHRVGRTGRAGRGGVGITLVSPAHRQDMLGLARRLGLAPQPALGASCRLTASRTSTVAAGSSVRAKKASVRAHASRAAGAR